jgi:hypothetical protein
MAGANLALFALPKLRAPSVEDEDNKWNRLRRAVSIDDPDYGKIRYAMVRFLRLQHDLEKQDWRVRVACLAAAVLAVAMLSWSTCYADDPVNAQTAWVWLGLCAAPALYVIGHNVYAWKCLSEARSERLTLERGRPR